MESRDVGGWTPGSSDLLHGRHLGQGFKWDCDAPSPVSALSPVEMSLTELCFPQAPAALGHPVMLSAVSWLPLAQLQAAITVPLAPFQSLSEPYVEYLAPFHGASLMMLLSRCLC